MKIILSDSAPGAYRAVMDCLKDRLPSGGEHIVIVPDKFTAATERGVLSTLGLGAAFNVSVASFTRLAEKTIGREIERCLTPQGAVMLLAKVIDENRDKLARYGRAAGAPGFAEEFYAALTSLRNSGISADELRSAAAAAAPSVADKLGDLSLIYDAYLGALAGRHSDSSTRLEYFADALEKGLALPYHFYVADFYDFKAPELKILAGLSRTALSLTVGLVSGSGPNRRIYCDGVADRLRKACASAETVRVSEEMHPALAAIGERLFSYSLPERRVESGGKVVLRAAPSMASEVRAVAEDIAEGVRAGARYRDFEVVLASPDAYAKEVKSAFLRYGIPFFIDTREPLAGQTKVRFLLSAMAAARSNFARADVMGLVKNPLFASVAGVTDDDIFVFENYCLEFNIDRSRFRAPFTLGEEPVRARAEKVRAGAQRAAERFAEGGVTPPAAWTAKVRGFLDEAEDAWRAHTAKLTEMSLYYAKCAAQVDEKTEELLAEMERALDAEGDGAYFERIFRSMAASVKIALVPTFLDAVFVGDTHSRYIGSGDIFVLGATVGSLPAAGGGGAVVTPADEEPLAAAGLRITPSRKERLYVGLMEIVEIFKRPRGRLVISYPKVTAAGEQRPSTVISELCGMLSEGGLPLAVADIDASAHRPEGSPERARLARTRFCASGACAYEILKGLRTAEGAHMRGAAYRFLSPADKARIDRVYARALPPAEVAATRGVGTTSASRLEKFFSCPYRYFFAYRLGLKERREAGMESTDSGIILHYALEKLFKAIAADEVNEENIDGMTREFFDEAVEATSNVALVRDDPATVRRLARLKEECVRTARALYAISLRSEYRPEYIEAKIGGDEIPSLTLGEGERAARLTGRADRIDVLGDRCVIIDYKSYKSADLSVPELFFGTKIQPYLYACALRDGKGLRPSGVFYLPLYARFTDDGTVRFKYRGHVTSSVEEASRIDSMFAEDPEGSSLPYKLSYGKPSPKVFLSDEDFDGVCRYVRALAADGLRRIADGDIAPDPVNGGCRTCEFAGICGYSRKGGRRPPERNMQISSLTEENIAKVRADAVRGGGEDGEE